MPDRSCQTLEPDRIVPNSALSDPDSTPQEWTGSLLCPLVRLLTLSVCSARRLPALVVNSESFQIRARLCVGPKRDEYCLTTQPDGLGRRWRVLYSLSRAKPANGVLSRAYRRQLSVSSLASSSAIYRSPVIRLGTLRDVFAIEYARLDGRFCGVGTEWIGKGKVGC